MMALPTVRPGETRDVSTKGLPDTAKSSKDTHWNKHDTLSRRSMLLSLSSTRTSLGSACKSSTRRILLRFALISVSALHPVRFPNRVSAFPSTFKDVREVSFSRPEMYVKSLHCKSSTFRAVRVSNPSMSLMRLFAKYRY